MGTGAVADPSSEERYVTREQVLDQLVVFGWTDGIRRRLDDERSRQLASPRRTAAWAESHRDRAERLAAEGRPHPAGAASVERAKSARTAADAQVGVRVRSNG